MERRNGEILKKKKVELEERIIWGVKRKNGGVRETVQEFRKKNERRSRRKGALGRGKWVRDELQHACQSVKRAVKNIPITQSREER